MLKYYNKNPLKSYKRMRVHTEILQKKPFEELQKDASTYLQKSFTKIRALIAEEQLISNVSVILYSHFFNDIKES